MMEQQYNRFKDAPWFPKVEENIFIGGAGGIGSWLAFFLSRAGFKCTVYDFDSIEEHNLGGQLFRHSDVGRNKVAAVSDITLNFCNNQINAFAEPVTEYSPSCPFTFSAFDNMAARRTLFNRWKSIIGHSIAPIFIDGRLEAEQLQIFCVTPENMDEYEREHLFDDSQVEDQPCTMKQTSHTAAMIASHMMAFFTNHMTNIYARETIRLVPFYYEYFIPANITEEG